MQNNRRKLLGAAAAGLTLLASNVSLHAQGRQKLRFGVGPLLPNAEDTKKGIDDQIAPGRIKRLGPHPCSRTGHQPHRGFPWITKVKSTFVERGVAGEDIQDSGALGSEGGPFQMLKISQEIGETLDPGHERRISA